jgi:hypothetical protein
MRRPLALKAAPQMNHAATKHARGVGGAAARNENVKSECNR